jgi:hypothetical protein
MKYKIYRSTSEANWREWDLTLTDLFKKISPHGRDEPTRLFVHPCSRVTYVPRLLPMQILTYYCFMKVCLDQVYELNA